MCLYSHSGTVRQGARETKGLSLILGWNIFFYRREMFYLRGSSRISTKIMCCRGLLNVGPSLQIYHPLKYWKENASILQCAISVVPIKAKISHLRFNVTALPWSGWAAYKMLGFNVIATSLANPFPWCWLVSVCFSPISKWSCYRSYYSSGTTLIHPTGSTKIPIIPSNLPGIMFSRMWSRGEQIKEEQGRIWLVNEIMRWWYLHQLISQIA